MKNVLVTGGTGNLGKQVVDYLQRKNYSVCVLSTKESTFRRKDFLFVRGDLSTNTGLDKATSQADIIIHCASDPRNFEQVDLVGTRNLLQSINRAITQHIIYISIVGVNKSTYPYYRTKFAAEELIANSGIPYTILRTTQFHNFILSILKSFINSQLNGVASIPSGMRFQSVDVREVAGMLVDNLEHPAGLLPDFGGPQILTFEDMVQSYLNVTKTNVKIEVTDIAGEQFDLFRSGVNLSPNNSFGNITWQSFLEQYTSSVTG